MSAGKNLTITVHDRTETGKNSSFRARSKGLVPGVVYGPKMKAPISVAVDQKSVTKLFLKSGHTNLVTLETDEKSSNKLTGVSCLQPGKLVVRTKLSLARLCLCWPLAFPLNYRKILRDSL